MQDVVPLTQPRTQVGDSRIVTWLSLPKPRFLFLQGLVSLVLSYELLLSEHLLISVAMGQWLAVGLWVVVLSLLTLPISKFETAWLTGVFLISDTIVTATIIYLSGNASTHVYIAFFLLLLIAASVQSLKHVLSFSLLLCVGYGAVLYHGVLVTGTLSLGYLLSLPVLLVMAVFYGLTLESLSRERIEKIGLAERVQGLRWEEAQLLQHREELEQRITQLRSHLGETEHALHLSLSERDGLKQRLQQAQKMEAVGRLSGIVARDFSQVLRIIGGQAGLLLKKIAPQNPARIHVQHILKAGDRGAVLTGQLQQFCQPGSIQVETIPLNVTIEELQRLLRGLLPPSIQLRILFDPAVQCVEADRGQLELVMMNLVVNARDAMPHGGQLTIETRRATEAEAASFQGRECLKGNPNGYCMMAVSDTGIGMSAEIEARLFEPFFSTKEHGLGTGLATVYGIVKHCGGTIDVHSQPGKGTTCRVLLPSSIQRSGGVANMEARASRLHGRETVLFVEEEEVARKVGLAALQRHDYYVLEARTPVEALLVAQEFSGTIHILVCNAIMPDINGRELTQRLSLYQSGVKTVYMAGYTDDMILNQRLKGIGFLKKPYRQHTLVEKVREVLDSTKEGVV